MRKFQEQFQLPKLPKEPPVEDKSSGYKFQRKSNGDIFVVEMSKHEHKFVITLLMDYLKFPNGNMIYDPSTGVVGQLFHFNPPGVKELIVLNVAIYPNIIHVRKPSVQHPGTSDANML
ncbi:14926_t:CDS:2 [Entrophospora sp. SA101]|nr:7549_t:CDS:2 [Entrophospora sp. SA101]CAJ0628697.1 14926_t:CDS:2 [Entrophospora sp. SA101]